jgi:GT2 family glycosyltransferase
MGERHLFSDTCSAPTFSVVMPAYNTATMIGAAIESVLAQTRGDFELIVVDDGSTDDTPARVEEYLGDGRVKLIRQPNRGQAHARNVAIEHASGICISLLDSDDLWLPRYLETMGATLEADPGAAVAYTDAWILDDKTRRIARQTIMASNHPPSAPRDPEPFLRALLEFGNFVFVGATIRTSILLDVGGFRTGVVSEDYEMWLRIAARGYRFVRCPATLAIYRRRVGQTTAQPDRTRRAENEVFRVVEEEYEVPDDIRMLARQRIPLTRIAVPRRSRRLPRALHRPYEALSRLRRFYFRSPREVRTAFPDLHSL